MNDTPFYVTLPSDASMDQYPENNSANWTTKLKHPVSLRGKWEVALVEMQYLNSLSTLSKPQQMIVRTFSALDEWTKPTFTDHVIKFPPGHYQSAQSFLDHIRRNIPKLDTVLKYRNPDGELDEMNPLASGLAFEVEMFSATDHRLRITLASPRVYLHFPPDSIALQKILGFDQCDVFARMKEKPDEKSPANIDDVIVMYAKHVGSTFEMQPVEAPRPLNPLLGNQSLFVYCDVADYSLVGDTASQILRSVSIKGSFMELITERFDIPHYAPVLMNHFETISVSLATDLDETAKFATGKALVKLHFRPRRAY